MDIINMDKSFVHLKDDGTVFCNTKRFSEGDYTISFFHLTEYQQSHPDYWELHPNGDEMIFLIEGKLQVEYIMTPASKLVAEPPNDIAQMPVGQGQSLIIPKGYWHRLLLVEESKIMVIAKNEGSKHRPVY